VLVGARFSKNQFDGSKLRKTIKNKLKLKAGGCQIDPGASKTLCEKCFKKYHRKTKIENSIRDSLHPPPHPPELSEGDALLEAFLLAIPFFHH